MLIAFGGSPDVQRNAQVSAMKEPVFAANEDGLSSGPVTTPVRCGRQFLMTPRDQTMSALNTMIPLMRCQVEAEERQRPFEKAPYDVLANPDISAEAKLLWLALGKFIYEGVSPTNAEMALACGWKLDSGRPAVQKVRKPLLELERLGIIDRNLGDPEGGYQRNAMRMCRMRDWTPEKATGSKRPTPSASEEGLPTSNEKTPLFESEGGPPSNQKGLPIRGFSKSKKEIAKQTIDRLCASSSSTNLEIAQAAGPEAKGPNRQAKARQLCTLLFEGCADPSELKRELEKCLYAYLDVIDAIGRGELTSPQLAEAIEWARSPGARKRAGAFFYAVEQLKGGKRLYEIKAPELASKLGSQPNSPQKRRPYTEAERLLDRVEGYIGIPADARFPLATRKNELAKLPGGLRELEKAIPTLDDELKPRAEKALRSGKHELWLIDQYVNATAFAKAEKDEVFETLARLAKELFPEGFEQLASKPPASVMGPALKSSAPKQEHKRVCA